jgi:hypothetical protein
LGKNKVTELLFKKVRLYFQKAASFPYLTTIKRILLSAKKKDTELLFKRVQTLLSEDSIISILDHYQKNLTFLTKDIRQSILLSVKVVT